MKKYVIFYSVLILFVMSFESDHQAVALLPDGEIVSGKVFNLNDGYMGDEDGNHNNLAGDIRGYTEGSLKETQFADIFGITLDQNGAIYLTEPNEDRIRKMATEKERSVTSFLLENGKGTRCPPSLLSFHLLFIIYLKFREKKFYFRV